MALSRPPRQDRAKSSDAADRGDPRAEPSSEPEAARPDSGSEQTSRALRDRLLDLARSVATEAREFGLSFRSELDPLDWMDRWVKPTVDRVRWIGIVASDVADYAASQLGGAPRDPSERLSRALNRMIVDSAQLLIEAKKDLAICMADRKRLRKNAETETARARAWASSATKATEEGDQERARDALERAEAHERIAKHARLEANRLDPRIAALLGEVRSFDETLQKTRLTLDSLRATERSQRTISYAAQQVHRLEQLASTLATMTASERAGPDALSPDAEEEPRR